MKIRTKNRQKWQPSLLPLLLLFVTGLTALLAQVIYVLPTGGSGLSGEVAQLQKQSGVSSPVTAVLMNFRGYDTLLEVMVLLLAVIGAWSLTKAPLSGKNDHPSPVLVTAVRLLAPLLCLVAMYLVWQGGHEAGGAFQGGALLGGAGVLMLVADLPLMQKIPARSFRLGLLLGPIVFLAVALFCLVMGGELLAYPQRWVASLLLLIETACAVSIGLALASLFAGGRPPDDLLDKENPAVPYGEKKP
jgi:multisubunit Na+/H+ antiporter MnhB subunit